jgi:hypothetical protein
MAQLAAAKKLAQDVRASAQDARDIRKAQAKQRAEQLRQEMRLLSKLLAGDPKALARQVARIAKEMRAVLKDFGAAHKADVQDATLAREAAKAEANEKGDADAKPTPTPPSQDQSLEARRREAGLEETPEAREMKAFISDLRGMLKKLREMLQEAKIKAGPQAKDAKEKRDPFEVAADALGELEDDLNNAYQDVEGEAKLHDAPAGAPGEPGAQISLRV